MMKLAFLKIAELTDNLRHIRALFEYLKAKGVEFKEIPLDPQNVQKTVDELKEFRPPFTIDINGTAIIVGEKDGQKVPLYDLFGYVHFSFFTEDPLLHFPNIYGLQHNNMLAIVTDIKYVDSLRTLGVNNISFVSPFLDFSIFPEPSKEKEIDVAFLGPVIDPQIILNAVQRNLPEKFFPIFVETGEFMFRNPEVHVLTAINYVLSFFNPQVQEEFKKWSEENRGNYFRMLNDISMYATMRKRWFIVNFLEGIDLKIIGEFQGQKKEDHEIIKVKTHDEALELFGKIRLMILSFPFTVPSGIGYIPLEVSAMGCAPMIDFRGTLPGFMAPGEEIITYTPLDRADIEEKVLYYLENPSELEEIGKRAREAVISKYRVDDRGEFIYNLMKDILSKAQKQEQNKN